MPQSPTCRLAPTHFENARTLRILARKIRIMANVSHFLTRESNKDRKKTFAISEGYLQPAEFLEFVARSELKGFISLVEDLAGRHTRSWGECGACARACNPLSGGFGHQRSGITTGVGGATLDWDRLGAGNARAETDGLRPGWRSKDRTSTASQEAWPEAELGGCHLPT